MKIFTRYFFRELFGPFFVGLGFFIFILILNPIIQLIDRLIVKNVPLKEVLLLFLYLIPSTVAIALPMATLIAVLMSYGRMSSDSEVIAMRASGISYLRIFYPAILMSIFISFVGIVFNDTLLPKGNYAFVKLYREIVQRKPLTELNEHTITPVYSRRTKRFIGIDKIDEKNNEMKGIEIYERDDRTGESKTINAESGKWLESIERRNNKGNLILIMRLQLNNGYIQQPSKDNLNEFSNIPFKKFIINFPQRIEYSTKEVSKGPREKTSSEIMQDIKAHYKRSKKRPHKLWVEYHKRFSIPFAALAFVLIGLPFSIVSGRSGKSISLGVSIIIIFIYYLFYTFGEGIGRSGKLNEIIALWLVNVLFFLAGSFYIYKISKT